MIRAVLDTNVLASGLTHSKSHSGLLVMAWRRRLFQVVTSEHILAELAETLRDRYFTKLLSGSQRRRAVARARRQALVTEISDTVSGIAPSEADDLVLATATSAEAAYLVTKDEPLQAVSPFRGVQIVSPEEFLDILKKRP